MALLRPKKDDPLTERSRALNREIEELEAQIRDMDAQLSAARESPTPGPPLTPTTPEAVSEPVFERVEHGRATTHRGEKDSDLYNDLGVRKYDLAGAWRRLRQNLQGPASSNPRLISYLAAGSIQGLRPLRYEKRVARNRVIALSLLLTFVLWGLIAVLRR